MGACKCNIGLGNTGRPGCVSIQSVTSSIILVPIRANDGSLNRIDLASFPVFTDMVNNVDPSKRWFPLPTFENSEQPRAESIFEEAASGRKAFLRSGKRSFTGELWEDDATPTFLGKLKNARCVEFGVYVVDIEGNLIGSDIGDGFLYPMPVDNNSFDPMWMAPTDSTVMKIVVSFDFSMLFDDSTIAMITADEAGINFNSLEGLKDVEFTNVISFSPTIDFDAKLSYGTAANKIKYQGAILPADWIVTVNGVPTVPTTVTETAPGSYTLNIATLVANDVVVVSVNQVTRPGYIGSFTTVPPF